MTPEDEAVIRKILDRLNAMLPRQDVMMLLAELDARRGDLEEAYRSLRRIRDWLGQGLGRSPDELRAMAEDAYDEARETINAAAVPDGPVSE